MASKTGRFFSPLACSLVLSLLGPGSALAQAGWTTQAQDLLAQTDAQVGNGLSDPSLAVGLSGFSYYKSPLFLNLMKQAASASIWIGDQERLDASALTEQKLMDSLGYPTRMVEGNAGLPGFKQGYEYIVSIHHPLPEIQAETAGEVILEWTGQGRLAAIQLKNVTETPLHDVQGNVIGGRITGTWPEDSKLRILKILETDPDNPIRDVSIVKAEYQDLYEAGAIFDPRFLRLIQDHHTLRFMDWMRTNGSDVMTLEDVLRPEAATWAVGVDVTDSPDIAAKRLLKMPGQIPFAVMVQLANEVGADPWFNIPLKANDAYVTALAAYVAEHLDPGLIPIFELSNEVWNFGGPFEQTREASLLGSQATADRDIKAARYYYGYRSAALRALLNAAVPERAFRLVMGTQTVNYQVATLTEAGVEAYFKDQGRKGQMSDVFDALAVTGYFNAIGSGDMEALRTYWYAQSESRFARGEAETKHRYFVERAADYLANGVEALDPAELPLIKPRKRNRIHHSLEDPIEGFLRETFAENKKMAEGWDLELIQYEADSHIAPRNYRDDPESEWFKALNNSPEMGKLITRMAEIFREEGGTLVNDFGHLGQAGFGLWGSRAYLADENPISAAYDTYNQTAAQSFGSLNADRMPGVFLQGVTETGSDQGDVLIGTAKRDYLLGKGGADLLVGGPAPDGLHGGAGIDMVLLRGAEADYTFEADALGQLVVAQDGVADRLVDIELIGFAGSGEIRRVADWTGEVSVPALQDLIDTFAKGNPKGETLGL